MADETVIEPDANELRDIKCIPIVRGILVDMAADLIPEDANVEVNYLPVIMNMLKRTLDADTNLTTENPYIFQMIKGVFMALSVTAQGLKPSTPIDDVRYGRIAKQIVGMVAAAEYWPYP